MLGRRGVPTRGKKAARFKGKYAMYHTIVRGLIAVACMCFAPFTFTHSPGGRVVADEPAASGSRTLLLVDDHHVLYRSGTERVFHPARLNPTNPVVREDRASTVAEMKRNTDRTTASGQRTNPLFRKGAASMLAGKRRRR